MGICLRLSSLIGEEALLGCGAQALFTFFCSLWEKLAGREFFANDQGGVVSYQQLGLYGKLVHPLVATLIAIALVLVVQAKIWRLIKLIKLPLKSFLLLLLFIVVSWLGEHDTIAWLHSQVTEELAEFGAYMMMYYIMRDLGDRLMQKNNL